MNLKNLFKKKGGGPKTEGLSKVLAQEEELKFWKEYAELMTSKHRNPFLKGPCYQQELKIIKEFIEPKIKSKKEQKWLDIGCGVLPATELIWEISEGKAEIWAGDIYLEPAKKRLKELGNPSIKLEYIDLSKKLPFPDNFFDGIVASKVLTYISEYQGRKGKEGLRIIFQEMFRILKPEGVLIWSYLKKKPNRWIGLFYNLGYILNPYQWIKQKYFLPFLGIKIAKFFKPFFELEEKLYPFSFKEYDNLLIHVGFKNSEQKFNSAAQLFINKVNKPL